MNVLEQLEMDGLRAENVALRATNERIGLNLETWRNGYHAFERQVQELKSKPSQSRNQSADQMRGEAMKDEAEQKAEAILLCQCKDNMYKTRGAHLELCPAFYRPAVAAALNAAFVRGLERALELMRHATFYGEGITAILAEIDKAQADK